MIDIAQATGSSQARLVGTTVGLVFLIFNAWTFREAYLLKYGGMPVQGKVSTTHIIRRRGSVSYDAEYTFDVSGKTYGGSASLTRDTYLALRPGGPIALRYARSSPDVSEAWEMAQSSTTLFLTLALGFPVSLLILILAFRQGSGRSEKFEPISDDPVEGHAIVLPNIVKGIAFTLYPVTDMKRARKFYECDLGLKSTKEYRGEWVEYHLWDNCFAITTMTQGMPSSEVGGSIAFEVENVDDFVETLRQKGIRVKIEPFSTPICRMAVVIDPDGNALGLHKSHSLNGPKLV